ncbi:pyrimidine 5'-nucleotidase [Peziza echinospora]|nr:pyrimidine 5'-nucleotidase [Peziza echinospora]
MSTSQEDLTTTASPNPTSTPALSPPAPSSPPSTSSPTTYPVCTLPPPPPTSQLPDPDPRPVFFFDIDNCLYPRSLKIHDLMKDLIDNYFRTHLHHSPSEAKELHQTYYLTYGLALSGLLANPHHHHPVVIDPMHYNKHNDDALPLEDVIKPIPALTSLLQDLKKAGKVKLWLLTNAYINHARRVITLLGLDGIFDGTTYCDYEEGGRIGRLVCKPSTEMYLRALRDAGVRNEERARETYFVDDSYMNCRAAYETMGWRNTVHLLEPEDPEPETRALHVCTSQVLHVLAMGHGGVVGVRAHTYVLDSTQLRST